jgi:uncharacterized BrkB/YihY/UPF0761 family membrane protein
MMGKALFALMGAELANAKYTAKRALKRVALRSGIWCTALLIMLGALLCFVVAGHLALLLVMPPIAAWLTTGLILLTLGFIAALIAMLIASIHREH